METNNEAVVVVDLGTNRANRDTEQMKALVPGGDPYVYHHFAENPLTGTMELKKTRFSVWIATRRRRLGRAFKWSDIKGKPGIYKIWLD